MPQGTLGERGQVGGFGRNRANGQEDNGRIKVGMGKGREVQKKANAMSNKTSSAIKPIPGKRKLVVDHVYHSSQSDTGKRRRKDHRAKRGCSRTLGTRWDDRDDVKRLRSRHTVTKGKIGTNFQRATKKSLRNLKSVGKVFRCTHLNVRGLNRAKEKEILRTLKELNIDVCVLAEVHNQGTGDWGNYDDFTGGDFEGCGGVIILVRKCLLVEKLQVEAAGTAHKCQSVWVGFEGRDIKMALGGSTNRHEIKSGVLM